MKTRPCQVFKVIMLFILFSVRLFCSPALAPIQYSSLSLSEHPFQSRLPLQTTKRLGRLSEPYSVVKITWIFSIVFKIIVVYILN